MRSQQTAAGLRRSLLLLTCTGLAVGCEAAAPLQQQLSPATCERPSSFADGRSPRRVRHVATTGDDTRGDGSVANPFRTVQRAAQDIEPGTAIQLHQGRYAGGIYLRELRGTADAPIWLRGTAGEPHPLLDGGGQGLYISRPRFVVVEHLEIANTADNGINVDDGDEMSNGDAARFLLFRDLRVHDTGRQASGVPDCLKLAGVNDVVVMESVFERCGRAEQGAVGVNGVGVHRAVVSGNVFRETGFGGVQFKGGSREIAITGNDFIDAGWRGVNMGGHTGGQFFRPPMSASTLNTEAAAIRVESNMFLRGETAASFTGCVDCRFTRNTVVDPSRWALRILQETVTEGGNPFAPAARGVIEENSFYFNRAALNTGEDINIGPGTEPASFSLARNRWYAHDEPGASAPRIGPLAPVSDAPALDAPQFVDARGGNYRVARSDDAGAPAACAPGMVTP